MDMASFGVVEAGAGMDRRSMWEGLAMTGVHC
jgi:hypothetical protein